MAVGLITFGLLNARYLYNMATGPYRIDRQTLEHTRDPGSLNRYYCTLKGDKVIDTGVRYSEDGKETASYLAVVVDNRLLLAKTEPGHSGDEFTGALVPLPSEERQHIISQIEAEEPEVRGAFLPVMLDAGDFRGPGLIGLVVGLSFLILAGWNLTKVASRGVNPESHPIVTSLARLGEPRSLATRIDDEVAIEGRNKRIGRVILTPSFLLRPRLFGLTVVPCGDVVWIYKKVTKHSVNFIPTHKTYAVMVADKRGKLHEFDLQGKEGNAQALIQELYQRAPWCIAGFSSEIATAWKSNRAEVLRVIDARRTQMQAAAAAVEPSGSSGG
jgi:hypothetical protein